MLIQKNTRPFYFLITIFVIVLGILSRKIIGIPLSLGDILYAVMVYFGIRMFFITFNTTQKIIVPLLLCYFVEMQQLYDAPWLVAIRETTLGHYVLGEGFLWSDMACYTFGVAMAFFVDTILIKKRL